MERCEFCNRINSNGKDTAIEENDHAVAFAGNYYREGHCSIILKRHITSISELYANEFNDLFTLVTKISKALEIKYNASKTYLLAIGDKVEHLHFHLIPKHKDKCSMGVYCFGALFESEGERKPITEEQVVLKNEIQKILTSF
jgi:diadenosine tetraphosphate (Ap4A) HIT family hydrolase